MDLGASERLPVGDLVNTREAAEAAARGALQVERKSGVSRLRSVRASRLMISQLLKTKWER